MLETRSSGISRVEALPQVLKYPRLLSFKDFELNIKNVFCYVTKHYGKSGLSVLIYRQPIKDQVIVICGDWYGNNIDLTADTELSRSAKDFTENHLTFFITTMRLIKIEQVQLFFSMVDGKLVLVDIQTAINKMSGPGMVRDVFGSKFPTQEVLKIEVMDDRAIECIKDGSGSYAGDLIIKPSRFRMHHDVKSNTYIPLYVEVVR